MQGLSICTAAPSIKSNQMERAWWGNFHRAVVTKTWVVCLWGLFFFFAHSSISLAQKIRLYRAQAVKLVLDRCIAYAPQGQMGLEKRVCELESERNKIAKREVSVWVCERMAGLLNAQTSLGGAGVHVVDSLLVITAVTFLTATFRALASGWWKTHPCFNFRWKQCDSHAEEGQLMSTFWRKWEPMGEEVHRNFNRTVKLEYRKWNCLFCFIFLGILDK